MEKTKPETTLLPLCFCPVELDRGWYSVSTVPYVQLSQEIMFLHTHDCCEFGICLEGAGVFLVGAKILPFQRGGLHVHCGRGAASGDESSEYDEPLALAVSG